MLCSCAAGWKTAPPAPEKQWSSSTCGAGDGWSALAEFAAVSVPAHEEVALTLALPRHALQRWQVPAQEWRLASGPWQLAVGFASDDIRATFDFELTPDGKSATGAKPGSMSKRVGNMPALFLFLRQPIRVKNRPAAAYRRAG